MRESMRKFPHHRRNTVSLPIWCDGIKQEDFTDDRRQSMNDLNNFCHLTREQLIQRVVQLEKEKQLSACSHIGSISPVLGSTTTLDHSDADEIHPCLWNHCDASASSLDQLISHIRDIHIGSGKAAYYCEWSGCSRNQKPFLKRHKMQNHMRTHTGERPFECHIEECDKKFSRPDSLNTHIKTHSSIRPYACPVDNCGKAYFHSRSLRKHAKSHETSSSLTPPPPPTALPQHPYNRGLKPNKFYQLETPTTTTNITPTMQPYAFYADVKVMDNYEQQQQQIAAAGTAYYSSHYVQTYDHQLMTPY
ncbi:uncharacterized protein EV154DRAFT_175250 [Mucor mucedo]|uniref:uncharacterized protein n=1 Tax=Mucor mucedo TaxID=29922 RepID=UPI00221FA380|nr:uncharacterized protein EV154DRAFT_175250 [Mucor mucedo]KAI7896816.1 hypothetical protein EV154DRAFT_175250 [Mucor mucedo]